MDHDFGKRLTQARLARGVTIEEAANATRMRPSQIQALESGTLTQFPNPAYAKSFLLMYARFLEVDITKAANEIDTGVQMRVQDFQYLSSRASEERRFKKEATDTRYDFVVAKTDSGSWTPLFVVLGIVVLGGMGFMFWNNLHRLDDTPVAVAPKPAKPSKTVPGFKATNPTVTAPTDDAVTVAQSDAPIPPPVEPAAVEAPDPTPAAVENPAAVAAAPTPPAPPMAEVPVLESVPTASPGEAENQPPLEPGTIVLEPHRKTWITIRTGPGGQPLYEDFLYPTAKAMHLPQGRYFIELKDANGVEITKDGKVIAYTSPGILVD